MTTPRHQRQRDADEGVARPKDRALGRYGALERVQAYMIARELGRLAWDDTTPLIKDLRLAESAGQLMRAIGDIAARIAEGYSRRSRADRIRYYEYADGSTNESISWYETVSHGLPSEVVDARCDKLVSVRRLVLTMIRSERIARSKKRPDPPSSADNDP